MKRGFSLIEIVIAMFLVSICLAMLMQLFPLAHSLARSSDQTFQAAMVGQAAMESALVSDPGSWAGESSQGPWTVRTTSKSYQNSPILKLLQIGVYSGDSCCYALETIVQ
jgi:prepilin-type N-terminal cleavage/methylation domain-containing protein